MGFDPSLPALELDTSVHALATGHPAEPLIAITDQGIAAIRGFDGAGGAPTLVPLLELETSLTGSGSFYSQLSFLEDLDGDDIPDLLLPTATGWVVYGGTPDGFEDTPSATLIEPEPKVEHFLPRGITKTRRAEAAEGDEHPGQGAAEEEPSPESDAGPDESPEGPEFAAEDSDEAEREDEEKRPPRPRHRVPTVRDVSGDGLLDLLVLNAGRRRPPVVFLNTGDLHFGAPIEVELGQGAAEREEIVFLGDLDGDGSPVLVSQQEHELPDDAGWRKEMAEAKRPHYTYRLYRLDQNLAIATDPHHTFEAIGYTFEGQEEDAHDEDVEIQLPGGFQDLDGDGRLDLVAITLDFSLIPLIFRVLVTGSISLRMDFHPWCQRSDGGFSEVPDLDLSGKFKINLRKVQIKHLSQFAGDFNGDGRADFVQLGRGRKVTIHEGGPGCTYPRRPDRTLKLAREPEHLGLVRILDLDGNHRSDIYVVHLTKASETGESRPVRLDLYLGEEVANGG